MKKEGMISLYRMPKNRMLEPTYVSTEMEKEKIQLLNWSSFVSMDQEHINNVYMT